MDGPRTRVASSRPDSMFSKATKGPGPIEYVTPRRVTVASLVADGVRIHGNVVTAGDLHLDGAVEGDITVGRLTIGESGLVTGKIQAETVEVRGRVIGSISAHQVRLLATSRVDGDISHAELSMEAGATFEGRSLMIVPAPVVEPASPVGVAAE